MSATVGSQRPRPEISPRTSTLLSSIVLAGFTPMTHGSAQSVGISIGIDHGPARAVALYSSERSGDWRTHYQEWQPVTLCVVNGRYCDRGARGSRAVVVYRRDNDHFLPPSDREWQGKDKRFENEGIVRRGREG